MSQDKVIVEVNAADVPLLPLDAKIISIPRPKVDIKKLAEAVKEKAAIIAKNKIVKK